MNHKESNAPGGQSEGTTTLIEKVRHLEETASPYTRVCWEAGGMVSTYATTWVECIKPWDDDRPGTVIDGKPRHTKESHEAKYPYGRENLEHLVRALMSPDDTDPTFARKYTSVLMAIYALREGDRERLRAKYQEALDKYPPPSG